MESMNLDRLAAMVRGATEEIFSTMLGIDIRAEAPYEQESDSEAFDGVIALVGLAGAWVGSGRISCSAALACRLSGAFLASEYTAVNEDVLDAMSELANMIVGNVKSALEDELGPMGLSIPTVIFGRNYKTRSCGVNQWMVTPFYCDTERLEVKIALMPNGKADAPRTATLQEAF